MVKIVYKAEAIKQLKHIGPIELKKARKKIISLAIEPLLGKPLQGKLKGLRSLKGWPLRIIYTFHVDTKTIVIETVDYRGHIY